MTQIVNINIDKDLNIKWCTRGTIFGNCFEIGRDGTREEVIEKYKKWFNFLIKDKRFVDELEKLRGKKIGCVCKTKENPNVPCHLDIIKNYLDNNPPLPKKKYKLAVVGSRLWTDKEFIFKVLTKNLDKIESIISGGSAGPDSDSVTWAIKYGIQYTIFPALWHDPETGMLNKGAGYHRNYKIVDASDYVMAFHANNSRGTAHTIQIAKESGKPLKIFTRHFENSDR